MKMILYYVPWSKNCRDIKWFIEISGIEVEVIDITNQEHYSEDELLEALAKEQGITKLPALKVVGEGTYMGAEAIKKRIAEAVIIKELDDKATKK